LVACQPLRAQVGPDPCCRRARLVVHDRAILGYPGGRHPGTIPGFGRIAGVSSFRGRVPPRWASRRAA
jgi:hypothetical protein